MPMHLSILVGPSRMSSLAVGLRRSVCRSVRHDVILAVAMMVAGCKTYTALPDDAGDGPASDGSSAQISTDALPSTAKDAFPDDRADRSNLPDAPADLPRDGISDVARDAEVSPDLGSDHGPICTPGNSGCTCLTGATCNPGLVCDQSLCRAIVCGDGKVDEGERCDDGNQLNTDACLNTCVAASCGDGYLQTGKEECDDGNQINTDACSNACKAARCGDGIVQGTEECDDGATDNGGPCLMTCKRAKCGDGFVQRGVETCDDGNTINTDACSNTCKSATCGDGIVQSGEQCDDGNTSNTDACLGDCTNARCGDGFIRAGVEACDDGNTSNTDACTNACALARCGDGFVQGVEQCDDGNTSNTDACTNACALARCGDGFVQGVEQCDDGNTSNTDACLNNCTMARCGDGIVRAGVEACDDGNISNTDTCTNACAAPRCGDGFVQGTEQCDDGNTIDTDSCTNACARCAPGFKLCGSACIGMAACCTSSDCPGVCQTCPAPGATCAAVKNMDDSDSCAGTCDPNGACRSKRGQTCQTVAGGCVAGTTCAPDGYCCNTACGGSCEACDIQGFLGTCTPVASGAPHGNRSGCGTDATCKGQCAGRVDALCSYPTGPCGGGSICSGVNVVDQSICGGGACVIPSAHACSGGFTCSGNACRVACSVDADCLPDYFCRRGLCHRDAKSVAIGSSHVCVLLVDGSVRCWGSNESGQLGNGSMTASPTPVVVTGIQGATAITASRSYTLVLMSDATLRHWGNLVSGTGTTFTNVPTPAQLTSINTATGVSASSVFYNCAALRDGTAQCWGSNVGMLGTLGNGDTTTSFSATPVTVANLTDVTAVATGSSFACAFSGIGAWCWGNNLVGQLGDGSTTNSAIPVIVSGLPGGIASMAASNDGDHVCVVMRDSTIRCWGGNVSGQLGNGTTAFPRVPTPPGTVVGLSGATAVALGTNHTCALLTDGTVRCWGFNGGGALGNGSTTDSTSPQPTSLSGSAISIAAGFGSTCAVLSNGAVVCWGAGTLVGSPTNILTPTATPDW